MDDNDCYYYNDSEFLETTEEFHSSLFHQSQNQTQTQTQTPSLHTETKQSNNNVSIFDALSTTMGTSKNPFSSTSFTNTTQSSFTQLNQVAQSYQFYRNSEDAKTMIKSNRDMIKVLHETMVTTLTKQKENDDLVSQRLIQLAEMTMLSVANINQQQNVFRDNLNTVGDEIKLIKERLNSLESLESNQVSISTISKPETIQQSPSTNSTVDIVPITQIVVNDEENESFEIVRLLQSFLKNGLCCCGFFKGFCPIFSDKELTPQSFFVIHVPSLILGLKVSLSLQDNKRYSQWLVSSKWSMDSNSTLKKLFWDKFNLIPERVPGSYISMIRPFLPFIRLSEFSCFLASSFQTLIQKKLNYTNNIFNSWFSNHKKMTFTAFPTVLPYFFNQNKIKIINIQTEFQSTMSQSDIENCVVVF